ncbi:MAG TPA: ATP-binding cassette domain-containing protein, partial [Polyangiaceae bacterium]|nr:ATP-binding cassette domain-containing protein [Polyangiaceae bacterium]
KPSSGALLVAGLDPRSVSEAQWRALVASVPQFHENYVFSNTLSFNVDPKRGAQGLHPSAAAICQELGLDHVLAKMPAGPAQLLGETGWQLSHGERSRLFIARALLQDSEIVIFDESFAALDPVTLKAVVACVRRRARTLVVIAHV